MDKWVNRDNDTYNKRNKIYKQYESDYGKMFQIYSIYNNNSIE